MFFFKYIFAVGCASIYGNTFIEAYLILLIFKRIEGMFIN
jgi:hypothetical protein